MTKYKIPKPRECFNCGGKCYARDWFDSTTTSRPYAEGVAHVYWQCADCGRRFETMEHIDHILIEVEEKPQTRYTNSAWEQVMAQWKMPFWMHIPQLSPHSYFSFLFSSKLVRTQGEKNVRQKLVTYRK